MADIIDTAAEIEELQRNAALSAHRVNRNEPIPEPRRAAVPGCQTFADCHGVIELKNKQRGL